MARAPQPKSTFTRIPVPRSLGTTPCEWYLLSPPLQLLVAFLIFEQEGTLMHIGMYCVSAFLSPAFSPPLQADGPLLPNGVVPCRKGTVNLLSAERQRTLADLFWREWDV